MSRQEEKIKELESEVARLKSSVAELKVLNEIAISSGKAANIDQILNLIVHKSLTAIEAEQGSIHLVAPESEYLFKTIIRQDDVSSLKHNYHIGANITGWVLLNKKPLIIENLLKDKRFNPTDEEKKDIHSVLCVPIWLESRITGIMMLINKKNKQHFSQDDLTLFSIISVQAGQLIKNLQLQQETFERRKETEQLQEIDKLKTNFFTNISHELRTPLTLIHGPAKQIYDITDDEKIKEYADLIYRNARKLNRLINQLLDLSSIEAGMMKLKTCRQNLVPVIKDIVSSFQPFAERKKISLKYIPAGEEIVLYIDKDKIEKILSNLLSNAIKFTPQDGLVNVDVGFAEMEDFSSNIQTASEAKYVAISVSDTGIGIPKNQINKIFDRFYQVDKTASEFEGSGIGLSLTKELVELHKGKIFVESKEEKGSVFKVHIPLGKNHLLKDEICKIKEAKAEIIPEPDEHIEVVDEQKFLELSDPGLKPSLLIVEDNTEVRKYISGILIDTYRIFESSNGEEGLNKSFEQIPDLIISDIMMPGMDGNQLCMKLKSDSRTSHIPVILLTAKATIDDKIEGLDTGADDYMIKPFEASELKARIKNLLEQRERIQEHFRKFGFSGLEEKNISSMDQKFLNKVVEIINKNISDTSFSVEMFAENLAVSRSLLHKKLIALSGETPGELIRRYRLNKAAKMLEQKTNNITQIAYEVGFNDPAYFTVCFKKQFGFSPSHYHRK